MPRSARDQAGRRALDGPRIDSAGPCIGRTVAAEIAGGPQSVDPKP